MTQKVFGVSMANASIGLLLTLKLKTPLLIKVLYAELKDFEEELKIHADIENRILLPKALKLELKLKQNIVEKSKFN